MTIETGDDLAVKLADLVESHCRHVQQQFPLGLIAQDGSAAARDVARKMRGPGGPWTEMPLRTYLGVAGLRLTVALDHVLAVGQLARPPLTLYSWATVARTAVEASARARWLLAPHLSIKTRVRRSLAEQLEHVNRTAEVLRGVAPYDHRELRAAIVQEARDLGIQEPGGLITAADAVDGVFNDPLISQMRGDRAEGRRLWHYLSGATHGAIYFALTRLAPGPPRDEFSQTMSPHVPFGMLMRTVRATLVVHSVAVTRAIAYAGSTAPEKWPEWYTKVGSDLVELEQLSTELDQAQGADPT